MTLGACGPQEPTETGEAPPRTASTAQALLASPEISLPLSVATGNQHGIVAASSGELSLVVWSETDSTGQEDIRGMRVRNADGALLDAEPLCIACGPGAQYAPSVASNGTDFLVAYDDIAAGSWYPSMRSIRVRGADGAVLGPPRVIRSDFPAHYSSAVASDGSNYLVVWRGFSYECTTIPWRGRICGYYATVFGARVSAADGSSTHVSLPMSDIRPVDPPQVTYGGGNYLVTVSGTRGSSTPNVYSFRLRASNGAVLDWSPRTVTSGGRYPAASFDGNRYLVVWTTLGGEIRASRQGQDGTVLEPGGFLVGAGDSVIPANVLFDGTDYRVAWEQGQELVRPLKAVRVKREGQVVSGSESVLVDKVYPQSSLTGGRPALAALGSGRFLLGYTQFSAPLLQYRHAKLRVVEDFPQGAACTQDAQCQSGYCVDGVCCESACGGGAADDCQACGVAAGGTVDGTCGVVRAEAAVVCRPSAVACDLAEVCDGTGLSCPADEPAPREPDLSGDKCEDTPCELAPYLAALGPDSLEPSFAHGLLAQAEAACRSFQSGNTRATQGQLRALRNTVLAQRGQKLSASVADTLLAALEGLLMPNACGPVYSPPPEPPAAPLPPPSDSPTLSPEISLPIAIPTGRQTAVVTATAGDITLVVWSETDAYGYEDVRATRMRQSDGALLDATPLCISCTDAIEYMPAVASNGTDFLVTWNHIANTSPRIRSVRVRGSDGAVLGPSRQLSPEMTAYVSSSVASDGSNYLVTWFGYHFRCEPTCGYYPTIQAARVSAVDGSGGEIFAINPSSHNPTSDAQVTHGGSNYLVTWSSPTSGNVHATRVRASDGAVVDAVPLTLAQGRNPVAAFDGSRFLVTWSTPTDELRAGRLGQDGEVLEPGGFHVGTGRLANVLFDGADYRVAWEEGQELVRPMKSVRVTPEGQVASGSEFVFAEHEYPQTFYQSPRPALATLGRGRFLLGYAQSIPGGRVKLRMVEDMPRGAACTQGAQCQSGYCVDGVCCESACGGGVANDCQACSVAAGGTADGTCGAVRAEAAVVCRPSAVACDLAEVCDGTSLSCPADEPPASEPDLSGDKCEDTPCTLVSYLAALGPESMEQPFGRSLQAKAEVACRSFQSGNAQATRSHLESLYNQVSAQHDRKLSACVADTLLAALEGMLGR